MTTLCSHNIAGRQRLCAAHRRQLDVPRYRRTTLRITPQPPRPHLITDDGLE